MIEIITKDWPLTLWYEIVDWCYTHFGKAEWDNNWYFSDDYSIYIHEKYLPFFLLRWA
jgi:hypothetical protein